MEFYDVVEARRSVRAFEPTQIPREVLERVLAAAEAAPSSGNSQPWRFHVCTGESRTQVGQLMSHTTSYLAEYLDILGQDGYERAVGWYSTLGDAPVVVVVSASEGDSEFASANVLISIGCAIENLQLAATAEGLGTCNITFSWWVREELESFLELDEGRSVASIVVMGYPASNLDARPPRRADDTQWLS